LQLSFPLGVAAI